MWFEISWFGKSSPFLVFDQREFFKLTCFMKGSTVDVKFGFGPGGRKQCTLPEWLNAVLDEGFNTHLKNHLPVDGSAERMYRFICEEIDKHYGITVSDSLYKLVNNEFHREDYSLDWICPSETRLSVPKVTINIDECMNNLANAVFGNNNRIDWDTFFLYIATVVSFRSTCERRRYGAVIVKNNKIVSTGYNGAPRGQEHCLGNTCVREKLGIPHGQQYEKCVAVHAEQNAIISGDINLMNGAVIYISGYDCSTHKFIEGIPCDICRPMLINAGITRYITRSSDENSGLITTEL